MQNANITARTNSENIPGIGYRGAPAVTDGAGTFELTIDGILTHSSGVRRNLYDYQTPMNTIQIDTTDADEAKGLRCLFTNPYVTSINFNFNVNENGTSSWTFAGDDTIWSRGNAAIDPVLGTGTQFNPTYFDEIVVSYNEGGNVAQNDAGVVISGLQSASFAATLGRTDVMHLGQKTALDRSPTFPFDVAVTLTALAEDADRIVDFTNSFRWADFSNGNGITIGVYSGTIVSGINLPQATVIASGLRPTEGSVSIGTGANSTTSTAYNGDNLSF